MQLLESEGEGQPDRMVGSDSEPRCKVVVKCGSGEVLKGYLEATEDLNPADLFRQPARFNCGVFSVTTPESNATNDIRFSDIKAIYLVKSFEGDPARRDLHFYSNGPEVGNVWVEVRFTDAEVLEGLVDNSVEHLTGDGLLLKPSDPDSNNHAIYINKATIAGYRVLGVMPF